MSQEKETKAQPRTVVEIQQEYGQLCAKAGQLQYTIHVTKDDLAQVNNRLKDLNFEYVAAQRSEQEAKPTVQESKKDE